MKGKFFDVNHSPSNYEEIINLDEVVWIFSHWFPFHDMKTCGGDPYWRITFHFKNREKLEVEFTEKGYKDLCKTLEERRSLAEAVEGVGYWIAEDTPLNFGLGLIAASIKEKKNRR